MKHERLLYKAVNAALRTIRVIAAAVLLSWDVLLVSAVVIRGPAYVVPSLAMWVFVCTCTLWSTFAWVSILSAVVESVDSWLARMHNKYGKEKEEEAVR